MSDEKNDEGIIAFGHTEQPRIVFPTLFTPRKYKDPKTKQEVGEAKYSASFLFPEDFDEVKVLRKKAVQVLKAAFPDVEVNKSKLPFTKGAKMKKLAEKKKKDGAFYEGMIVLKTSSKFAPTVLDARKDLAPVEDEKLVASGSYVAGEVNFVAYESDDTYELRDEDDKLILDDDDEPIKVKKKGVTAYVNTVVFVDKGPRIAGRDAAAAFKGIKGKNSQEDPTGGDGIDLNDGDDDYDFD